MPLDEQRTLGAHLVDLTRALLFELYERLAMAGFDDLGVDTAGILKDVERDGSTFADLAQRTQTPPEHVREIAERLQSCGYAAIDGDCLRLTERGWAAVEAGHRALTEIEASWAHAFGEERFRAFATMLDELVAWHAFGASPSAAPD
jgi:hypothetical protein